MSTDATKLENEMSIIRDPDDQTRQMKVGSGGQIYFEQQSGTSTIVSGLSAVGSTPTLNPVSVSGIDPAGLKRHLRLTANGNVALIQMEVDSTGIYYFPINSCAVVDTQDASGYPATTTVTDPFTGNQFRKTYTYVNGVQTAETAWVKL